MPQMAPISWLILFMFFSFTFILFNILNYFCFNNVMTSSSLSNGENDMNTSNKNLSLNWKW